MATEKPVSNRGATPSSQSNPAGNPQGGKAGGKNNRRRSLRNKRRGRKPGETVEARPSSEPREQPVPSRPADKSTRENRDRRRRRRMRAKQRVQTEAAPQVVEDVLKDLPPLVPAFVYTHVLRPVVRDSFEFRTEHFSKVTRRLEDFHIDLSPLYPEGGDEIKSPTYMPPAPPAVDDPEEDGANWQDGDEEYDADAEVRSAAEESLDAARLEGATIADLGLTDEDEFGDIPGRTFDTFDTMLDEAWDPDEGDDLDALA